ncbi:MAG: N-acetyltransferase, partial [Eubacteriales bacterium]|nr:N-acetyltransferase [Eubacteriales bacterium]
MIRCETAKDYEAVYHVVQEAFAHAEHSDGSEQDLVAALRKSDTFVPALSLAAESEGNLVGHILFSKVTVGDHTALALAPLSVLPSYQRRGIGKALIREGHRIAKKLGFSYVIVLGDAKYYSQWGYVPASRYGIRAPFAVDDENFMAIQLLEHAEPICGIVQ